MGARSKRGILSAPISGNKAEIRGISHDQTVIIWPSPHKYVTIVTVSAVANERDLLLEKSLIPD
jgi:hypothetical protein